MRLKDFKKDDLVTRHLRAKTHYGIDGSFMGDKFIFIGFDCNFFVLLHADGNFKNDILKIAKNDYFDDVGWFYYPTKLEEEAFNYKVKD